ncbi:universal stress protein [Anoxynatronum buryatiense]|uniref:Universal stress protein n=1 Tax=Anoxynatronum buryatiense TaxID=489973 RepID=A0AA45WWV1_9CLOT|nr:universal stress protein [Anoxynatronum buryatiense]SMP61502.1 Nucleotide-binding universal stress protein, UspA family [Anoxynatronum buryatiense]
MKKILVAVDGSEMSLKVLQKARTMAEKFGSEVLILTVVKKLRAIHYHTGSDFQLSDEVDRVIEDSAKKILDGAKEQFESYEGKYETLLAYGEPAEEILVVAEREKPDLLVMGSRGLSGFGRVMLGSVSTKVLHHTGCDMLIVRYDD